MGEAADAQDAIKPVSYLFAFLPWLRVKEPVAIAGVVFKPFRDSCGVSPSFKEIETTLSMILSSYVDRKGEPVRTPTIVTIPGRSWNLLDTDFEMVAWAAHLLFLASWGANEYFSKFPGRYVNSIPFRAIWQRSTGGPYIGLTARRRYGSTSDGAYKHGEIKFDLPSQCDLREAVVDAAFLSALDAASKSTTSQTIERLESALSFVSLANTDDNLMDETAEAILMASAFEQLFNIKGRSRSYNLGKAFATLFAACGSIAVEDAIKVRPGIVIDKSTPARAAAQPKWWVHQKWMEELYDLRSKSAHVGSIAGRAWGWTPFEHLVLAAFVFPLVVRMLLKREGHYALTSDDTAKCKALDKLLVAKRWTSSYDDDDNDDASKSDGWQKLIENAKWQQMLDASWDHLQAASAQDTTSGTKGSQTPGAQ